MNKVFECFCGKRAVDLDAFRGKCLQDSWNLRKFGGVDYCTNRYGQLEALSIVSDGFCQSLRLREDNTAL